MANYLVDGALVRRYRVERGWNQAQLSQAAGLDQGTVSKMEAGLGGEAVRLLTALRVARALGVLVEDLVVGAAPVRPREYALEVLGMKLDELTEDEMEAVRDFARYVVGRRRRQSSPTPEG